MRLSPGNAQWIGQREEQQDAFAFAHVSEDSFRHHGGTLAVVTDGMGGLANGAQASRLAIRTFVDAYNEKTIDEPVTDALQRAMEVANHAVWQLARDSEEEGNMGTTLVAAVVAADQLYWISAGDSRLYLFRALDNSLTQCTTDHNLLWDLMGKVREGSMSREEAFAHPEAAALISFLGLERLERLDKNLRPLSLDAGDRLLLCSDGLYGVLEDKVLVEGMTGEPQPVCDQLLERVKSENEEFQDNTTIVMLGCEADEERAVTRRISQTSKPKSWLPVMVLLGLLLVLAGVIWSGGWLKLEEETLSIKSHKVEIPLMK